MKLALPLIALLLAACASQPPVAPGSIITLPSSEVAFVMATAKFCNQPAVAISKVSAGFRYGCFCGAGYPDLRHASGKSADALDAGERKQLALQYFTIKPIDDIDSFCQAHDVCWVLNGDGSLECNEELEKALHEFQRRVEKGHSFDTDSLQFRCGWLALDISYASLAVMQSTSRDEAKEWGLKIARVLTSPLIAAVALITELKGDFDPYPHSQERCLANELAPSTAAKSEQRS